MAKVHSDEEVCSFLQALTAPDSIAKHDQADGWFNKYSGSLHDPDAAAKYVRGLRNTLKLGAKENLAGKAVLDVGSGFGMACVVMRLWGAERVEGIDTFVPMVETTQSYSSVTPGLEGMVFQTGLSYALPHEDQSFDIVLNFEALSHFVNQEQSLAEAVRVLKTGGRYVIADDNNGANAGIVQENREIWDRFENGPTGEIHGHRAKLAYVDSREQILQEAFPELAPEKSKELAINTAYMLKQDVIDAGKRFLETGELPASRFQADRCPVEPHAGQFMENLIDPRELCSTLKGLGCDCDTVAYFGGDGKGGLLKLVNGALNTFIPGSLLIKKSPGFKVYAKRTRA